MKWKELWSAQIEHVTVSWDKSRTWSGDTDSGDSGDSDEVVDCERLVEDWRLVERGATHGRWRLTHGKYLICHSTYRHNVWSLNCKLWGSWDLGIEIIVLISISDDLLNLQYLLVSFKTTQWQFDYIVISEADI